jgi:hypothetical protein
MDVKSNINHQLVPSLVIEIVLKSSMRLIMAKQLLRVCLAKIAIAIKNFFEITTN